MDDLGSLLCAAVDRGDLSEVRRLVARGADVNSRSPEPGQGAPTALHVAVWRHPAIVEFLLQEGASPHLPSNYGTFPLQTAVYYNAESVELLLAAPDIDLDVSGGDYGFTLLHHTLLGCNDFDGPMEKKRAWSILNLLIEAGANIEAVDVLGRSVLIFALFRCHREAVKILLRAGAKVAAEHPHLQYMPQNEAAFALYARVKAAGDWKAYARKHQRVLAGLVRKCAPRLPDDAARLVVGFWTPPGGYYMC